MFDVDDLFKGNPVEVTSEITPSGELEVVVVKATVDEKLVALTQAVEDALDGRRIEDIPCQDGDKYHVAKRALDAYRNGLRE